MRKFAIILYDNLIIKLTEESPSKTNQLNPSFVPPFQIQLYAIKNYFWKSIAPKYLFELFYLFLQTCIKMYENYFFYIKCTFILSIICSSQLDHAHWYLSHFRTNSKEQRTFFLHFLYYSLKNELFWCKEKYIIIL